MVQERTKGKSPKPKHDPQALLGIKKAPDGRAGTPVEDPVTGKMRGNPMKIVDAFRSSGGRISGLGLVVRGATDKQDDQ